MWRNDKKFHFLCHSGVVIVNLRNRVQWVIFFFYLGEGGGVSCNRKCEKSQWCENFPTALYSLTALPVCCQQACHIEGGSAGLIPSQLLEEKRKAFVKRDLELATAGSPLSSMQWSTETLLIMQIWHRLLAARTHRLQRQHLFLSLSCTHFMRCGGCSSPSHLSALLSCRWAPQNC